MSLSVGIVGLPNVGKSTLFNALCQRRLAKTASHPFTTIEPHEAVVAVPDPNLQKLHDILVSQYPDILVTPATVTFIDIAGLVKGAAEGEGLGNKFLAKIREVDVILHVVRVFEDQNVPYYGSSQEAEDLKKNIEIVQEELRKAGIEKPTLFVLNIGEKDYNESSIELIVSRYTSISVVDKNSIVVLCAKVEEELSDLSEKERKEYLLELGIKESGLEKLIKEAYKHLNLITFYTIKGGKEVRATPIVANSNILQAAEKIHTDFAKKFIKAEAIPVSELIVQGSRSVGSGQAWKRAHEAGKIALAGRDYIVKDGDVIEFKIGT